MDDLRAAIIGYGLAGQTFHAPLVASTPGLEVATIVTGNPERQESARHILDLEQRIRTLEAKLGPKVIMGGRSGS